tara:strand:+ start:20489 stop:21532 length:1044 start_codon:yes stop_codon:yes gene_type:complete
MRNILVTGGAGYIGSHTIISLLKKRYNLTIIDSFKNSSPKVIERIKIINQSYGSHLTFKRGDLRDKNFLNDLFQESKNNLRPIESVIHFSGLKSVAESKKIPLDYWEVNVCGTINLLMIMEKYNCKNLIFSSSATVYGEKNIPPFKETDTLNPINPYAKTKEVVEKILCDIYNSKKIKWNFTVLRYFNPIGAHSSGLIGEDPKSNSTNLFPIILNSVMKNEKLYVFGLDWPTTDGSCIRDYIHIEDLAEGHIKALENQFLNVNQFKCFNLGTGCGTSVLELISIFEKVNNVKISYEISSRREGDTAILVADNSYAKNKLNWYPLKSIDEMCKDGYRWILRNPNGYDD